MNTQTEPDPIGSLIDTVFHRAHAGMMALSLLDEFDDAIAIQVLGCSSAALRTEQAAFEWNALFERLDQAWMTREHLRDPLRLRILEERPEWYHDYVARLLDVFVGNQLPVPAAVTKWLVRYRGNELGPSLFFLLATEEPLLARRCVEDLVWRSERSPAYMSTLHQLRSSSASWQSALNLLERAAAERAGETSSDTYRSIRALIELLGLGHSEDAASASESRPPRVPARLSRSARSTSTDPDWSELLVERSGVRSGHTELRWHSVLIYGNRLYSLALSRGELVQPTRSDDALDRLSSQLPDALGFWWHDPDVVQAMEGASADACDMLGAAVLQIPVVSRTVHQITIEADGSVRRSISLWLRSTEGVPSTQGDHVRHIVLWQIPDSASSAGDFRLAGADGLPLDRPDAAKILELRALLSKLLDSPSPIGGPQKSSAGRPIPILLFGQLDRLSRQTWRLVASPRSRAESEIRIEWTEEPRRGRRRWSFGEALAGTTTFRFDTAGFSPEEDMQVVVKAPDNFEVAEASLIAPKRGRSVNIPAEFIGSAVVTRLQLARSIIRRTVGGLLLLGTLAIALGAVWTGRTADMSASDLFVSITTIVAALVAASAQLLRFDRPRFGAIGPMPMLLAAGLTLAVVSVLLAVVPFSGAGAIAIRSITIAFGLVLFSMAAIVSYVSLSSNSRDGNRGRRDATRSTVDY